MTTPVSMLPCPSCEQAQEAEGYSGLYFCHDSPFRGGILCSKCDLRGPLAKTEEEAATLWNALPRRDSELRARCENPYQLPGLKDGEPSGDRDVISPTVERIEQDYQDGKRIGLGLGLTSDEVSAINREVLEYAKRPSQR